MYVDMRIKCGPFEVIGLLREKCRIDCRDKEVADIIVSDNTIRIVGHVKGAPTLSEYSVNPDNILSSMANALNDFASVCTASHEFAKSLLPVGSEIKFASISMIDNKMEVVDHEYDAKRNVIFAVCKRGDNIMKIETTEALKSYIL